MTAPNVKAGPIGEGAAVGAGLAGFAAGSALGAAAADGYVDDGFYDAPVRRPYRWGGPELVGYDWVPAGPVVETEETRIVSRPRTLSRTVVEESYAPSYRGGYETSTVRRGYGASVGTRAYGTTYGRDYGYRTVGSRSYLLNERRGYGVGIAARGYGVEGAYRSREGFRSHEGFRSASVRGEGLARTSGIRDERAGFRDRSMRGDERFGRSRSEGWRGGSEGPLRNVSAGSGESMSRGAGMRGGADMRGDAGMRGAGGGGTMGGAGGPSQLR